MRADEAGLVGHERAFDMPADDGGAQFGRGVAEGFEFAELRGERRPFVGDQREEIAGATGVAQGARGGEEAGGGLARALEINAGVAIHLKVPERRGDPDGVGRGGGVGGFNRGDEAVLATDGHGRAGGVVVGADFKCGHEAGGFGSEDVLAKVGTREGSGSGCGRPWSWAVLAGWEPAAGSGCGPPIRSAPAVVGAAYFLGASTSWIIAARWLSTYFLPGGGGGNLGM